MRDIANPASDLHAWLVGPARASLQPRDIVGGYCDRLVRLGIPLSRVRIAQRLANPLIGAWGVIWTWPSTIEEYQVPRTVEATASFLGSPFERVIRTRTIFRRSLSNLDLKRDHAVLHELAQNGSTDYIAIPIEYGDGSVQVGSFTTEAVGGFSSDHSNVIVSSAPYLSAALEPAAMRRSTSSLLGVYLGSAAAEKVTSGAFHRGATAQVDAVVLLTDLRGYTRLSEQLAADEMMRILGTYFEAVVDAVRSHGGDVLKFMGDGVLSFFPTTEGRREACERARAAVLKALHRVQELQGAPFVAALHVGPVSLGNIGSLDRLDFTVVGPTVNIASRLEAIAKEHGPAVCSAAVAQLLRPEHCRSLGHLPLRGVPEPQEVFRIIA